MGAEFEMEPARKHMDKEENWVKELVGAANETSNWGTRRSSSRWQSDRRESCKFKISASFLRRLEVDNLGGYLGSNRGLWDFCYVVSKISWNEPQFSRSN